jgi:hypothetical protein
MANIATNPWSFTNADQGGTFAITSIANNVDSILVTSAAHGFAVGSSGQAVSLQGTTNYNGGYRVLTVPSATTVLLKNRQQNYGAAAGGALGNMVTAAYLDMIRAEQILWQPSAAAQTLLLTDVTGNIIWNPTSQATADFAPFTYGKVYWVRGLVINTLPATGYIQITVN